MTNSVSSLLHNERLTFEVFGSNELFHGRKMEIILTGPHLPGNNSSITV
jgi:hypothetical protein